MWTCKHCHHQFQFTAISEKANHSRWCKSNPRRNDWNKTQGSVNQYGETKTFSVVCKTCCVPFTVEEREKLHPQRDAYYCSRSCANNRQEWWNENATQYRTIAFQNMEPKCSMCDTQETYLLVVHHIDGDRENNSIENLKVLCYNCHARHHLVEVNGEWRYRTNALTPPEKLTEILALRGE